MFFFHKSHTCSGQMTFARILRPLIFVGVFVACLLQITAAPQVVVRYDLSPLRKGVQLDDSQAIRQYYDEIFLVTAIQGLANRKEARLAVRYDVKLDDFWWDRLTESGAWLASSKIQAESSPEKLLADFRNVYEGLVVYDESVPATLHVAAAVAGADNLLPVRYDIAPNSWYQRLTTGANALPVKVRLIQEDGTALFTGENKVPSTELPSTGSAKNDAYRWLIEKYLKPGKLNPDVLAYLVDAFWLKSWQAYAHQSIDDPENRNPLGDPDQHTLCNLDFVIANRGIPFDLHVYSDEIPIDDPKQKMGTDLETYQLLLKTCNELTGGKKILMQYGFTPWIFKYTNFKSDKWNAGGTREAVHVEWRNVQVASAYNCAIDADALANFPNGSFTQHFPVPKLVVQKPRPSKENLIEKGILNPDGTLPDVLFYAYYGGDYDGTSWVYKYMPAIWTDPQRGALPISWAINPNLSRRFANGLMWIRATAKENDDFIAGDNGAGYLFPHQLTEPREFSGLPSGVALWEEHNLQQMKQWDLSVVGFVIDGLTPMMKTETLNAYARFAPGGIGTQAAYPRLHEGMPTLPMSGNLPMTAFGNTIPEAAQMAKQLIDSTKDRCLLMRTIIWKPKDFVAVEAELNRLGTRPRMLVDTSTLLWLSRYSMEQNAVAK